MTQLYLTHITRQGERWDSIAYLYYHDVTQMNRLIEANQHAPITPSLPAGITLTIPLVQQAADTAGLPPWKQ